MTHNKTTNSETPKTPLLCTGNLPNNIPIVSSIMNISFPAFAWPNCSHSRRIAPTSNAPRPPCNLRSMQASNEPSPHPSTTSFYTILYMFLQSRTVVIITETLRDFGLVKFGYKSQHVARFFIYFLNGLENEGVDCSSPPSWTAYAAFINLVRNTTYLRLEIISQDQLSEGVQSSSIAHLVYKEVVTEKDTLHFYGTSAKKEK